MSVYSVKGQGVEVRLHPQGDQVHGAWFKTKKEAKEAEGKKREELKTPARPVKRAETTPTDMAFLELVNRRLDYVKAYNSESYYQTYQVLGPEMG